MRWTQAFIPTLKETPAEAEILSHKLLLRAGLVRKLAGGLYTFLPLGVRVLTKISQIVREEMNRAGALEVLMPALQPVDIWQQSGRYETASDVLFKVKDRLRKDWVLGPTHEEVITELAAREINSYRQLPKNFLPDPDQVPGRDPAALRAHARQGVHHEGRLQLRRDWDEAADESYKAMYTAYTRIFDRCGLRVKIVEADTGVMGGKFSHEFMVRPTRARDGLVECNTCSYAANTERAERALPPPPDPRPPPSPPVEPVATPGARTIEQVAAHLKSEASQLIKTIIYLADGRPIAALVPGDRDVNEPKLRRAVGCADLAMADDKTIVEATGAPVGFAGPIGLSMPLYADESLRDARGLAAGANRPDTHLLNVDMDREAPSASFHDLVTARGGDACPRCDTGILRDMRGIEVGHVFKLGTKYSEAFNAIYSR
jgi:prolyl-tRNA synthetase